MSFKQYLKESKSFIIFGLLAAVVGMLLTFFIGCTKSDDAAVLASKRVKVDAKEMPAEVVEEPLDTLDVSEKAVAAVKKPSRETKAAPARKKTPVVKSARTSTAPAKKAVHKTSAASRPWAVNVISFMTPEAAHRLRDKLKSSGYNAYVTKFTKDKSLYYRVRVGFFKSREEAGEAGNAISKKFKGVGKPWVVKPGSVELAAHSG
ncbi:MAG: hypothetical protein BMS9Abin23_0293 [Thermodesulfobacteriota bacterium]|nr:MAG: hypothetical protein BMS9Abin23_0293 [Thermodesulfobacteriota bacterium]